MYRPGRNHTLTLPQINDVDDTFPVICADDFFFPSIDSQSLIEGIGVAEGEAEANDVAVLFFFLLVVGSAVDC